MGTLCRMAFRVVEDQRQIQVLLSGWDRVMCWRRSVVFDVGQISTVAIARRGDLEPSVDHRIQGIGTHDGSRLPGKRRVGIMMVRGARVPEFWALQPSGPDSVAVVLDLTGQEFGRAVLSVTDPARFRDGS